MMIVVVVVMMMMMMMMMFCFSVKLTTTYGTRVMNLSNTGMASSNAAQAMNVHVSRFCAGLPCVAREALRRGDIPHPTSIYQLCKEFIHSFGMNFE
jgi:hypothetical protein